MAQLGLRSWLLRQLARVLVRFIVRADELLTALLKFEAAIKAHRHNHQCDCPEPGSRIGK